MLIDADLAKSLAGPAAATLQRALRRLPSGGLEQMAVDAGEVDAVIDYGNCNVIMFPAAQRALRDAANRNVALGAPVANSVLAALPREEYLRVQTGLERVALATGDVLHEPGAPIRYVYFPIDCAICLLTRTEGQRTVETGLVGFEGVVGISLVLGVDVSPIRAVVQSAGGAMRMPTALFQDEFRRCLPLQRELLRYTYVKLAQARQTAACMACHLFEQRLACWLLMTSDRSRHQEVLLTHEYLAGIFGVRRVTVTMACASLRSRHLISYRRGKITILKRQGLEAASCSCYRKIEVLHTG